MIVICSYCREKIKEKPPLNDKRISHGCCDKCFKEQLKILEKL